MSNWAHTSNRCAQALTNTASLYRKRDSIQCSNYAWQLNIPRSYWMPFKQISNYWLGIGAMHPCMYSGGYQGENTVDLIHPYSTIFRHLFSFWYDTSITDPYILPVRQVILIVQLPPTPVLFSPYTWCHSDVTSPEMPAFCHATMAANCPPPAPLPCLRPWASSFFHFCFDILLWTFDWPRCHHRLYVLLPIYPFGPASYCAPSTHLCPDFLCLLADPLGFEDPPPGVPVARTRRWLEKYSLQQQPVSYAVCALLHPSCHLPYPLCTSVPPLALLTRSLPWTVWIARKALSPLSFWVLHAQPQERCPRPTLTVAVHRCLACLVLRTRSVMMRSPFFVYMSHPPDNLLLMLRPPRLQIVMMKFPCCVFHPALVLCDSDDEVLLPRPLLSCPSSTSCPFVRPLPAQQACG
jgi:hypothetical protein